MIEIFKKFKQVLASGGLTPEERKYAEDWMEWYIGWSKKPKPGEPEPQDGGNTPPPPPPHS